MRIVVAGAGRLGIQIVQVLGPGNEVTVVDRREDRLAQLEGHLPARLVAGDASDPFTLEEAGALAADLVIAATGTDEDNLVISALAKRRFAVPRVAARVNDPANAWLFDRRWGVDVAVPAADPLVSLIEEATGAAETVALLRLSRAGVNVIETAITERSSAAGRTLADVTMPAGAVVAAVVRDGRPSVPGPDFRLRPGDELLVVSDTATARDVDGAFQ